ncbi:MAG: hypothetical protein NVS9B10_27760 [Nevskia sp.]
MNAWRPLITMLFLSATLPLHAALLPRMVGHWLGAYHGQPIDLQMNADGSGSYQGQPMTWDVKYGQLHIEREGASEVYAMKADSETLIIAGGEMAALLTLVRIHEPDGPEAETQ